MARQDPLVAKEVMDEEPRESGREYPAAPLVGVGAIVIDDDKVLLVKRAASPGKDEWTLPGGLVNLGEEMRDALERELREECGIDAEVGPAIDVFDRIEHDEEGEIRFHYVIIDFLVSAFRGEPSAGSDAAGLAWASVEELKALGVPAPVRRLIEHAMKLA